MPNSALINAARAFYDAGFCVVPSHEDGSKRPFGPWKKYQSVRPDWDVVHEWLSSGKYTGVGVIMGAVSKCAEMAEIEGPLSKVYERIAKVIEESKKYDEYTQDLVQRILDSFIETTPGGGLHFFFFVDGDNEGNQKLAETADGKVIAETRGEGGFVVVYPTTARNGHEPGTAYRLFQGHPSKVTTISEDDRGVFYHVLKMALNEKWPTVAELPTRATPEPASLAPAPEFAGVSTFDDYRAKVTWRQILEPAGWTWHSKDAEHDYWVRPGKNPRDGHSASTIEDGPMFVFSSSVSDLPREVGLSKPQVFAHLHHDGDLSAATRALREAGYGDGITLDDLPAWNMPQQVSEQPAAISAYQRAVNNKYAELVVLEDARAMVATMKAGQAPEISGLGLDTFLNQPDHDTQYRVQDLWPAQGRVLLAAAAKSGKTTMVAANLLPSLVDGRQFLGRYDTAPVAGSVVLLNMEVGDNTLRRWLRDSQIDNKDQIVVANLRGQASALALQSDKGRERFAAFLRDHGAEVVILDPLAPVLATLGLDENSNADVARFFSWWSEALTLGGVVDDVVVHHAGHAGQRSRGASRLLDEPDAVWTLTRETAEIDGDFAALEPIRYLSAYGRDVDLMPESLEYDSATRSLRLTGMSKPQVKVSRLDDLIRQVMASGVPMTRSAIRDAVVEQGGNNNKCWKRLGEMEADQTIQKVGKSLVWPDAVRAVS